MEETRAQLKKNLDEKKRKGSAQLEKILDYIRRRGVLDEKDLIENIPLPKSQLMRYLEFLREKDLIKVKRKSFGGYEVSLAGNVEIQVEQKPGVKVKDLVKKLGLENEKSEYEARKQNKDPDKQKLISPKYSATGEEIHDKDSLIAPQYSHQNTPQQIIQDLRKTNTPPQPNTPTTQPPTQDASVQDASVQVAPVQVAPVQVAPVQVAPVQDVPVQDVPVQVAPVQDVPVQDASVQDVPVQDASVQVAPVQVAPVQDVPVQDASVQDVPVQDASVQDASVAQTQEAQVQEIPTQEASAQETQAPVVSQNSLETRLEDSIESIPVEVPVQEVPDAPVQEVPDAPVQDASDAPVPDVPDVPVQDASDAPVQEVPDAPVQDASDAPVPDVPDAPVQEVPDVPVQDASDAPVQDASDAPVQDASDAPVPDVPVDVPVQDASDAPVQGVPDVLVQDASDASVQDASVDVDLGGDKILPGNESEFREVVHSLTRDFIGVMRLHGEVDSQWYTAALLIERGLIMAVSFENMDVVEVAYGDDGYNQIKTFFAGSKGNLDIFEMSGDDLDKSLSDNAASLLSSAVKLTDLNIKIKSNILQVQKKAPVPKKKSMFGSMKGLFSGGSDKVKQERREMMKANAKTSVKKIGGGINLVDFARQLKIDPVKAKRYEELRKKNKLTVKGGTPVDASKKDRFNLLKMGQAKATPKKTPEPKKVEGSKGRDGEATSTAAGSAKPPEKSQVSGGKKVQTKIDELYELVQSKGHVKINDQLAKHLKVDKTQIEAWAMILEEHNLLELKYPAIGEPEILSIKKE